MAAKTYTKVKIAISGTVAMGVLLGSAFLGINGPSGSSSTVAASGAETVVLDGAGTTSSSPATTAQTTASTTTSTSTKSSTTTKSTARKSRAS